jgi:transaldolase
MSYSPLTRTRELGTELWNDSCALGELREAVEMGATGATSNPVIVLGAVKSDAKTWLPLIDQLGRDFPAATEDDLAWELIHEMGRRAAHLLEGRGRLSLQVNPKLFRDAARMLEQGLALSRLAPNTAVKLPCTAAGIEAMEELTARGVTINATVSFSVSQAVAAAEAVDRGLARLARAEDSPGAAARLQPFVTLMVGRLDDHLQRVMAKQGITIDPGHLHRAGIAVAKKAHRIFQARGHRARLLIAAYRHQLHWTELVGKGIILTMPYAWWKQFEASGIRVEETLSRPVDLAVVDELYGKFEDFRKAYDEGGLSPAEFAGFGPSVHTLQQFLSGYQDLICLVRGRMLGGGE